MPAVTECLNATTWVGLTQLAVAANSDLVVGLSIRPPASGPSPPDAPWNGTNARSLLVAAHAAGARIAAFELGNEQNTIMTAAQQAAAGVTLAALIDDVYGKFNPAKPAIVGPDTHSFHDAGSGLPAVLKFLQEYAVAAKPFLAAVTHHEYIEIDHSNVLNATFLGLTAAIGRATVAALAAAAPGVRVWAGEIGPHNGGTFGPGGAVPDCAGNLVCGRFGSTVWYADAMAAKAAAGYAAFCRQDVVGADYALLNRTTLAPTPDFYLLALWRAARVGQSVLNVTSTGGAPASTRAYAFCAAHSAPGAPRAAVLVLLNLDAAAPACAGLPAGWSVPGASGDLTAYTLTPADAGAGVTSAGARLNGGPELALDAGGRLPALPGAPLPAGAPVTLPPLSVTLLVVPLADGAAPVCE